MKPHRLVAIERWLPRRQCSLTAPRRAARINRPVACRATIASSVVSN